MTVVILANGEIFGGAERQIAILCSELVKKELTASLLLLRAGEFSARLSNQSIPFRCLQLASRFSMTAITQLGSILREKNATILHMHGYQAVVYGVLASVGKKNIKLVRTIHGRPQPHRNLSINSLKTFFYTAVENVLVKLYGVTTVYVSEDLCRSNTQASKSKYKVIHNGIDAPYTRDFQPPSEFNQVKKRVLVVGRLANVKGIDIAIKAIAALPSIKRPVLFIIGSGPQEEELKTLSVRLDVLDYVVFLGFRSDVYPYLANANALLIPSYHEGLPYVLLEAMAAGLPTICSNVGGMSEILTNNETSLLFPVGDHDALASCIVRALESREEMNSIAAAAQSLQARQFTSEAMTNKYVELFSQLTADQ